MHILMFVLNFFKRLSERYEVEALVHILYDTIHRKPPLRVPKAGTNGRQCRFRYGGGLPGLSDPRDGHPPPITPCRPSSLTQTTVTKGDAAVCRDRPLRSGVPGDAVRASCGGRFIPLRPEEVFESDFKAYPYPPIWEESGSPPRTRAAAGSAVPHIPRNGAPAPPMEESG